jgi:hypothetical protein
LIPNYFTRGRFWTSKNYETGFTYKVYLNDALCAMTIVRVLPMLHGIVVNTGYNSIRMQRLSRMMGFKADFVFTIKCLIKSHPLMILSIGFLGSVFIFAFTIRVCEL